MQIYGHRGAAGEAPENTIAGALHAIERGTRYVEIDLQLSRDDHLVVIHDKTLKRTAGVWGKPSHYKARNLAAMDARADGPVWPSKKNCGIPTLEAFLSATKKIKGYQLEVKPDSKANIRRVSRHLSERFKTAASARKVVVTSSSKFLHQCLGEMAPHIRRGMVISRSNEVPTLLELGCVYSAMHWSACDHFSIRKLKKAGVHISVWTVNDAQMIRNLYKMKVDSVITDYPSMAIPLATALQR